MKGIVIIWQEKRGNINLPWKSKVFHLGNGYFGASSYGGAKQEIVALGEKTFWTGGPGNKTDYNFGIIPNKDLTPINEIKQLTAEGNFNKADRLVAKYLTDMNWLKLGGLSTIGSLILNFEEHDGEIQNYERSLNLKNTTLNIIKSME